MIFPDSFFKEEEQCGFVVSEMMKRAWAAQIEEYLELKKICDENGLRVYADFGTLLGTVRHAGFIPWDDDLDVSMPRPDYMKLVELIRTGAVTLPEGYEFISIYTRNNYYNLVSRFMGAVTINTGAERMERFHGFPYPSGVDIFPLDYIPADSGELETWKNLMTILSTAHQTLHQGVTGKDDLAELLPVIEQIFGITLKPDEEEPLTHQLAVLTDRIYALYTDADADFMGTALMNIAYDHNYIHKSGIERFIYLPFCGMDMCVPANYEIYLRMRYGDDYMTPRRVELHDYPFYGRAEEVLKDFLKAHPEEKGPIELAFTGIEG